MTQRYRFLLIGFFLWTTIMTDYSHASEDKLVIAHRGASAYLPEHTLAAKAMAYGMGADYIEQDVVMTRDNELIILHDPYLDRVSNVMGQFPNRYREINGKRRWLAIDFTLKEVKSLKATQSFHLGQSKTPQQGREKTAEKIPDYPTRFPIFSSDFSIPTLAEEIELIQGLNHSTGKNVGLYAEIKAPWLHQMEGKDISLAVLQLFKQYGYTSKNDNVYIQCFDAGEVKRIHDELMPSLDIELKLVQLIAPKNWGETRRVNNGKLELYDNSWLFEKNAMHTLAQYVDGIGPWSELLIDKVESGGKIKFNSMVSDAHAAGLVVHPFTFRADPGKIPAYAKDFDHLLEIFLLELGVDGVFTDFPDKVIAFLQASASKKVAQ